MKKLILTLTIGIALLTSCSKEETYSKEKCAEYVKELQIKYRTEQNVIIAKINEFKMKYPDSAKFDQSGKYVGTILVLRTEEQNAYFKYYNLANKKGCGDLF